MRDLRNKLKTRRGASILMAMVLFLVATSVSAVIVTAVLSSMKRISAERAQQQEYLTLQSAAHLLEQCMERSYCTVTTSTHYPDPAYEPGDGPMDRRLCEEVAYIDTIYNDLADQFTSRPISVTVTPEDREGETVMGPAVLTFTLTKTSEATNLYQVTGTLKLTEGGTRQLLLSGQLICKTAYAPETWEEQEQDENGQPVVDEHGDPVMQTFNGTVTTVTVDWQSAVFQSF